MFELSNQMVKVAHVNLRAEKHGEEDVLACDLKFETKMPNTTLSTLNASLAGCLYERGQELDLGDDHVTKLRFPLIKYPLQWQSEITGGKVTLHAPISEDDLVLFGDVNELKLSPQDGGTVIVNFRVQFLPDGDQAARIPAMLGKMVEISVEKPVADSDDLAGDGGDDLDDNDPGGVDDNPEK